MLCLFQAGRYMKIFSLPTRLSCCGRDNPLVDISANWSLVPACTILISPFCIFYLMKWQSISMCLVRSWNTKFAATCSAPFNSFNKSVNHTTYETALAMLMYVHSFCWASFYNTSFLWFQRNQWASCWIKNSKIDFLVLGQEDRLYHKKVLMKNLATQQNPQIFFSLSW